MDTPWSRARKFRHEIQEEKLGRMPGGSRQIHSGRFWNSKRDGILHEFLVEARTTEHESYTIQRKEFLDIRRQAFQTPPGLLPAMQVDIRDDVSLMVIQLRDFNDLYTELLQLREQVIRNG